MACSSCITLLEKIRKAHQDQNAEKERVMQRLYDTHMAQCHPARHDVVAIEAHQVTWPNGTKWKVR